MNLALKSSPGFREKLAEREEAIPSCNALFHRDIFNTSNIRVLVHWRDDKAGQSEALISKIKLKREPGPNAA